MANSKKTQRITRPIIKGYLEKISSEIFDKHREAITTQTKGRQGLYALYRKDKLYYVGLAVNLRNRINHHLKDRHKGRWTHFSLYIIEHAGHIKELESLLLRIAFPAGNKQRGKLRQSANLLPDLKQQAKTTVLENLKKMFKGSKPAIHIPVKRQTSTRNNHNHRPLKGYFPGGKMIYAAYRGKEYKAWIKANGGIKYNGKIYDSPSAAGTAIKKGKAVDGWFFWKYKDLKGELIPLNTRRKQRKTV